MNIFLIHVKIWYNLKIILKINLKMLILIAKIQKKICKPQKKNHYIKKWFKIRIIHYKMLTNILKINKFKVIKTILKKTINMNITIILIDIKLQ